MSVPTRRRAASRALHPGRPLHWHPTWRDLRRGAHASGWPRLCRHRQRRVLSARGRAPADEQATAAGPAPGAVAGPSAALATARHCPHAVVEWNGKPVRSVRKSFASAVQGGRHRPTHHAAYLRHTAATWAMQHGGRPLAGGGLSRHDRRDAGTRLRTPPSRFPARCCGSREDHRDRNGTDNPVNKTRQTTLNVTKIAEISRGER